VTSGCQSVGYQEAGFLNKLLMIMLAMTNED